MAKMLLEKETIVHDDVSELIGPRPFKGDPQYEEFVRRRKEIREESNSDTNEPNDSSSAESPIEPGLAFRSYR